MRRPWWPLPVLGRVGRGWVERRPGLRRRLGGGEGRLKLPARRPSRGAAGGQDTDDSSFRQASPTDAPHSALHAVQVWASWVGEGGPRLAPVGLRRRERRGYTRQHTRLGLTALSYRQSCGIRGQEDTVRRTQRIADGGSVTQRGESAGWLPRPSPLDSKRFSRAISYLGCQPSLENTQEASRPVQGRAWLIP